MAFKFNPIQTDIPEHRRPEGSINAALHELPVRQKYLTTGTLAYLPRTGFIVTLIEHGTGGMRGVIVVGNATYPRGGYDIDVSDWEVQRAVVIPDGMLRDAALAAYQGNAPKSTRKLCTSLFLVVDPFNSMQLTRCSLPPSHAEPLHVDVARQQWWEDTNAVSSPWPKDIEPPDGINVLVTLRNNGTQAYLHRQETGWKWSDSPDRFTDHGNAQQPWTKRMEQIPHDDILVYPPDVSGS